MKNARITNTKTGGRSATDRIIMGEYALAVGMPLTKAPAGWTWTKLTDVSRLESGHTPSRRFPEYWGGAVPWLGIKDAREFHGEAIHQTREYTNQLGLENSSARLLPANTVCLSRTASVGYVVVMGKKMATSQDFVNWVCSDDLEPHFLKYLLIAEKKAYSRFSSGAVHQTIYFPEAKAFHVCLPSIAEQKRIVSILDEAFGAMEKAKENAERNLANAKELFDSYLDRVFTRQDEGWDETPLGKVCEFLNGYAFKSKWYSDKGIRLLRNSNVSHGFVDWSDDVVYLPDDQAGEFSRFRLNERDVVLSLDRPVISTGLKAAILTKQDLPSLLLQRVLRLASDQIEQEFIFHWLFSRHFLGEIDPGRSLGVPHISAREVGAVSICYPTTRDAQRSIIESVEKVRLESQRLEQISLRKIVVLDELKQSILQKAFTGQLTAKSPELELVG